MMAPMTEVIKGICSKWTSKAQSSFKEVKLKVTQAPVLALPCFDKVFEVEYNASGVGIGGVFPQEGKHLAFFNEKLRDSRFLLMTKSFTLLFAVLSTGSIPWWLLSLYTTIMRPRNISMANINSTQVMSSGWSIYIHFIL